MKLIDKDVLVAEIERREKLVSDPILLGNDLMIGERNALFNLLSFIDTLEVKDVVDYEEPDLTPIFEEMGIEPDSKIAVAFRNAFYKGVDNFCKRNENKP